MTGRPDWHYRAACLGVNPDLFFPERGGDSHVAVREARKVCAVCVVREVCAETALSRGEKHGIWGGMSERQRRNILKIRRKESAA